MTANDIRQIRSALRLTMREFATVLNVSHQLIGEWESGRHAVTPEMALHIKSRVKDYGFVQMGSLIDLLEIYTDWTACPRMRGLFA